MLCKIVDVSATFLQVLVNGTHTNQRQFPVGSTLTLVCTVQTSVFQWRVGSLLTGNDGLVAVGAGGALNTETSGMFTLTAEGASAPNFRSTLQVVTSSQLNEAIITCSDNLNSNRNQTAMVTIKNGNE